MLNINLKSRLENKAFWLSLISAIILLLQQLGLTALANYIPANYADIINSIFAILTILGVVVDTSTPGISDKPVSAEDTTATNNITVVSADTTSATQEGNSNTQPNSETSNQDLAASTEEDIKNAIVVNSTITPKASTISTEDTNA